jgi:hypothetical protein
LQRVRVFRKSLRGKINLGNVDPVLNAPHDLAVEYPLRHKPHTNLWQEIVVEVVIEDERRIRFPIVGTIAIPFTRECASGGIQGTSDSFKSTGEMIFHL